jgi:hypothetical protein
VYEIMQKIMQLQVGLFVFVSNEFLHIFM